ncbi:MAG: hypothetical protein SangKO_026020 [Sandaracinaceae bacterium]
MRANLRTHILFVLVVACGGPSPTVEPAPTGAAGGSGAPDHARGDAAFPEDPSREPLDRETVALLEGLETDIEVRVVLSPDLPAPYDAVAAEVRAALAQYAAHTERLQLAEAVVDPARPEIDGVPRRQQPVIEGSVYRVVDMFRGALIHSAHGRQVLAIDDAEVFERQLVRALRLLRHPPHAIGVVASLHREGDDPTLGLQELLGHYQVRVARLDAPIDPELRAILLVEPRGLDERAVEHLSAYLAQGGRLGLFGGGVEVRFDDPTSPAVLPGDTGLAGLLEPWGVVMGNRLVLDPRCRRIARRTGMGMVAVEYPPGPLIPIGEPHPLHPTGGDVEWLFSAALTLTDAFQGSVWLRSSERSTELPLVADPPFTVEPRALEQWPPGEAPGPRPLLVALEGALPLSGERTTPADSRVLIAGSGSIFRPDLRPQAPLGETSSASVVSRKLVDWVAGEWPSLARD